MPPRPDGGRDHTLGLQALTRLAEPDDFGGVVTFLASGEARWVTGDIIHVDGGSKLKSCADAQASASGRAQGPHSITASAKVSSEAGTARPRIFAVFRLMTNSNFVGCCTGNSPG